MKRVVDATTTHSSTSCKYRRDISCNHHLASPSARVLTTTTSVPAPSSPNFSRGDWSKDAGNLDPKTAHEHEVIQSLAAMQRE
eukprot:CAMPEP_0203805818 /NCGR_PEP_ID=MMETSP0100_2-20121128/14467_1 /ASSEMBLY_ACC=CAM_ASM_000210 /TAXON_ID=96639 /ORGANISM=" , Strain NY0313808BC1" /LENGTH=82 /DNA_ID=CAMNT_0050714421 /DNA_START=1293 /DNA_END=1541 /DNA_ORIENTATION=+